MVAGDQLSATRARPPLGQANAHAKRAGVGDYAQVRHDPTEPLGQVAGGLYVGVPEDGQEFVATHAYQQIGQADLPLQCNGHLLQNLVPGGMAHAVVDRLEVVEVQRGQGEWPAVASGLLDHSADALLKDEPVG